MPATWDICQQIVKEGGYLANVGVHDHPVTFNIDQLWIKNLTITTGLVNSNTTGILLKSCERGKLPLKRLATHRFNFDEVETAYDVFKHAAQHNTMKVIIEFPAA